jgi:hypothetical protein
LVSLFVERNICLGTLIGAHNSGISTGPTKAHVMLFNHGHIGQPVIPRQKVGSRQTVQTTADDNGVVTGFKPGFFTEQRFIFPEHNRSFDFKVKQFRKIMTVDGLTISQISEEFMSVFSIWCLVFIDLSI